MEENPGRRFRSELCVCVYMCACAHGHKGTERKRQYIEEREKKEKREKNEEESMEVPRVHYSCYLSISPY